MPSRNIKSAKDILAGHDFWAQRAESQRFVHHEFQDYAYRLASSLGDLAHKQIYMRLAKTTPRHLLEKALAFTGDYKDANKGRLFMWKLKQLRLEIKQQQDLHNFAFEFIYMQSATTQEVLAQELMRKQLKQADLADTLMAVVSELSEVKKIKALVAGQNVVIAPLLAAAKVSYEGWELSRKLVKALKLSKLKVKRIIPSPQKLKKYHLIWYCDYWKLVPLEAEQLWLNHLLTALHPGGILVLATNSNSQIQQSWEPFVHKDKTYYYYAKNENSERLSKLLPGDSMMRRLGSGLVMIRR